MTCFVNIDFRLESIGLCLCGDSMSSELPTKEIAKKQQQKTLQLELIQHAGLGTSKAAWQPTWI